jgi:hypothetical protein
MNIARFLGEVWNLNNNAPAANLVVEAFDACGNETTTPLARATTDTQGRFTMAVTDDVLRSAAHVAVETVRFRFRNGTTQLPSATKLEWNPRRSGAGKFEVNTARTAGTLPTARNVIEGIVVEATTRAPRASTVVKILRQQLSGSTITETSPLATMTTGADGRFRLAYDAVVDGPEILVVAETVGGGPLSRVSLNRAAPFARIDIVIGETSTRYRGLAQFNRVKDLCDATGTTPTYQNFTTTQVAFVSNQARVSRADVQTLVDAAKLNATYNTVSTELFFALRSSGVGATADEVFAHRVPALMDILDSAVSRQVIGGAALAARSTVEANLREAGRAALRVVGSGRLRLGAVVDTVSGSTAGERNAFLDRYLMHVGTVDSLWSGVDGDTNITSQTRNRIKFAVEAAPLSLGFLPLVSALNTRVGNATLSFDPRDLAKLTDAEWDAIITPLGSLPAGYTTALDYRRAVSAAVERRYRSVRLKARVSQVEPTTSPLRKFYEAPVNASFEFERVRVGRWLRENPTALDALTTQADKDEAVRRLRDQERLTQLGIAAEDIRTLETASQPVVSAHAIHQMGRETFLARFPNLRDREKVYDEACWRATASAVMRSKHAPALNRKTIAVLPDSAAILPVSGGPVNLPTKLGDWTTLFGSLDQCQCTHCRSVLSPAAYIVDVLEMLERVPAGASSNAKNELLLRRRDLERLALSCNNATTPMPYVDIVNEILEVRLATLAAPSWPVTPNPIETTRTADELAAHPEILFLESHVTAYNALEAAIHPLSAPFHLWQEEARLYLDHLGVSRETLLETLAPEAGVNSSHLGLERLRVTDRLFNIVSTQAAPGTFHTFWGLASGGWAADRVRVKLWMSQLDLTFDELREYMATNLGSSLSFAAPMPCDLEILNFTSVSEVQADNAQRLVRLSRALGWSISDTDRALALSSFALPDANQLRTLASLRSLQRTLGLEPRELLSWYREMDRRGTWNKSWFEIIFLDPRTASPSLDAFRSVLASGAHSSTFESNRTALGTALQLADADVQLLLDVPTASNRLALPPVVPSTDTLTTERLTNLYRVASLGRAAQRSIADLVVLRELTGVNPVGTGATPDSAKSFFSQLERFDRTGLTVEDVQYTLRNFTTADSALRPSTTAASGWISELESAVKEAAAEALTVTDADGSLLASLASQVATGPNATALNNLAVTPDTGANVTTLINAVGPYIGDTANAITLLQTGGLLSNVAERRAFLASRLSRYLACRAAVLDFVVATFEIDADTAAFLLGSRPNAGSEFAILRFPLFPSPAPVTPAVRAFLPTTSWDATSATASEREDILRQLHKAVLLIKKLGLTAVDLAKLYPNGAQDSGGLPFLNLAALTKAVPTVGPIDASVRAEFAQLLRLSDYIWVRDRYTGGDVGFTQVLTDAAGLTLAQLYDRLASDTGLPREDFATLTPHLGFTAAAFRAERVYFRLFRISETLRRLGVSASRAIPWTNVNAVLPTPATPEVGANALVIAREIKMAARAKHGEAWGKVGKDIRDPLRERQRALLVDTLVAKIPKKNVAALFEELLIDVEMTPCAITSRLVAAHGSLQTFTNRISLNLEQGGANPIAPTVQLAREWEWMHAYRLWEANRKVFLWPENWIEPELRGDKTPLFEDLEQHLLQGELDEVTAERAFRKYLDGLADIAKLEIVAVHTETLPQSTFAINLAPRVITHVIGRTVEPHRYFYRQKTSEGWTPWESIDVDLQGQHILPVALNGALYLFWLTIDDRGKPNTAPVANTEAAQTVPDFIEDLQSVVNQLPEPIRTVVQTTIDQYFATQEDPPQDERPAPMMSRVTVHAAVRRHDVWENLAGAVAVVQLQASPTPHFLSLVHRVTSAESVRLTLTLQGCRLADIEFFLGSRRVSAAKPRELIDPTGYYLAQTLLLQIPNPEKVGTSATGLKELFQTHRVTSQKVRTFSYDGEVTLFNNSLPYTEVVMNRDEASNVVRPTFVVQNDRHALLVRLARQWTAPNVQSNPENSQQEGSSYQLAATWAHRVEPFYHPFAENFRTVVAVDGLDGLFGNAGQTNWPQGLKTTIASSYNVNTAKVPEFIEPNVDFRQGSPFGIYNWELFFHAPFLIANRLSQEGRFADARKWYHTIFDPTDGSAVPSSSAHTRYWKFRPFRENKDLASIQSDLATLAAADYPPATAQIEAWTDKKQETLAADTLLQEIATWRKDPFDPHAIARFRTVAYQKAVVQKYIKNLLDWGDSLFTQDTMESVNEATQLYIHALQLLGPRPVTIPKPGGDTAQSYAQLGSAVDAFGNALVDVEVIVPPPPREGFVCRGGAQVPVTVAGSTYFCVPENDQLLALWDLVEDRLFKIRHCQNIEGVVRTLPLFQPPIDPALLVRAKALGIDLASVLFDLRVSAPPYRYAILAARALDYANALTGLGGALLSALEKKDGEELARMRASHDVANQEMSRSIRKDQLSEAQESLAGLQRSLATVEARKEYYDTREFMSAGETASMTAQAVAFEADRAVDFLNTSAAALAPVPQSKTGGAGIASPFQVFEFGGLQLANEANLTAQALTAVSRVANSAATIAGYERRRDDWKFQANQAKLELAQLEKQVVAAEIRVALAERELRLLEQQIDQSKDVERHLRRKFTNQELYAWMAGQLSSAYYQSYKLAFEMARHAERAFQFEVGEATQTFIRLDAWDGRRKGLLAGERLSTDLRRMDAAYHSQNRREHEITKTISLRQLKPEAFLSVREGEQNGAVFSLPESLFDEDFRDHYRRRIKSVDMTVQCTPGPYQSVNGRLTLENSACRRRATDSTALPDAAGAASIITSSAMNDAGVFEFNFRDERYLPFEYRGVHADANQWRFELMPGNEFDYASISDVVLRLRYTARSGRTAAPLAAGPRRALIRVPQSHADAWSAYKETPANGLSIATKASLFPRGKTGGTPRTVSITKVKAFYKLSAGPLALTGGTVQASGTLGSYSFLDWTVAGTETTTWQLTTSGGTLSDLFVAFTYTIA